MTTELSVLARGDPLAFEPEAGSEPVVFETGDELLAAFTACVSAIDAGIGSTLIDDCCCGSKSE